MAVKLVGTPGLTRTGVGNESKRGLLTRSQKSGSERFKASSKVKELEDLK